MNRRSRNSVTGLSSPSSRRAATTVGLAGARRKRTAPSRRPDPATLDGFSAPTREWLRSTPMERRRRLGQYPTPKPLRDRLLDRCDLWPGMRVLDPGVGTGEFLASVREREPQADLYGWDEDPAMISVARRVVPDARLAHRNALDPRDGEPFDLVVGNPPYFQFRAAPALRDRFGGVISGRVNIFALFFQVGLEALRPGGRLAFVVPPSMNNGAYFERLRRYLVARAEIEFLEIRREPDLFDRARTAVQLLVLRSGAGASDGPRAATFADPSSGFRRTVFSEDAGELRRLWREGRSLYRLGYEAVTGTVVWNRRREDLRRAPDESTARLIWSRDIGDTVEFPKEPKKPPFVHASKKLRGPAIVVNRILGAVGRGRLRCALVPEGMEFVAENHVNVVRRHGRFAPGLDFPELLAALRDPRVGDRARLLTGNTQLSAKELSHLLPL